MEFNSADAILARLDRSSAGSLLASLAQELAKLHGLNAKLAAQLRGTEAYLVAMDRIAAETESATFENLPDHTLIDSTFLLSPEAGFHNLEYSSDGRPFRWTGPDPSFLIEVLVARRSIKLLTLKYIGAFVPEAVKLRCFVDGVETLALTTRGEGEWVMTALLPERAVQGPTAVMMISPMVGSPAEDRGTEDARRLGVAFRSLEVTTATPDAIAGFQTHPEPADVAAKDPGVSETVSQGEPPQARRRLAGTSAR